MEFKIKIPTQWKNTTKAWALLPAPSQKWDLAHWIASCNTNLFFKIKNYPEAKKWAIIAIETKPTRATSSFIIFASICYELGEKRAKWTVNSHKANKSS
ncbi:hypothetical protein [Pseudomonas syringae]|uniref:hypothetical protein n=1 Tax=Pseudomonas syringae TaxID=317 RepID=UPI003F866A80